MMVEPAVEVADSAVTKPAMGKPAMAKPAVPSPKPAVPSPGKQHVRLRVSDSFESTRLRGRGTDA